VSSKGEAAGRGSSEGSSSGGAAADLAVARGASRARAVTISAAYGTGGGIVGPEVARRLGTEFLDRAISVEVARQLDVSVEHVVEQEAHVQSGLAHWLEWFAPLGTTFAGVPTPPGGWADEASYLAQVGPVLEELVARGGVVLGRAAAVVLREKPGILHVRLDGPLNRRVSRAAARAGISEEEARKSQRAADGARERYVKRFYHADISDHHLYHLVIDATVFTTEVCVDLIVHAAENLEDEAVVPLA
jgi:cytidylate kinase